MERVSENKMLRHWNYSLSLKSASLSNFTRLLRKLLVVLILMVTCV